MRLIAITLCALSLVGAGAITAAAQATGGSTDSHVHSTSGKKATKLSKAHKGGKKSKKGSSTTTTPPPK